MLGYALRERFARCGAGRVLWTDVGELDITDARAVERLVSAEQPGTILNCAALTDVDGCESRREEAFRINGEAVGHLARAATAVGARLIQISTDFVFSGECQRPYREDDAVAPLSVYGASKLAGEEEARRTANHLIVRTAWLYGPRGKNFVRTICERASTGQPLRVVADQVGCPTYTFDLTDTLTLLLGTNLRGVVHAVGRETTSWLGFARAIMALWRPSTEVAETTSKELRRPARRPAYSVLDCSRLRQAIGCDLPGYGHALPRYLPELRRELGQNRSS